METKGITTRVARQKESKPFYVRRLTKSGSSRYLSITTILPTGWQAVKVTVEEMREGVCILRIDQIK